MFRAFGEIDAMVLLTAFTYTTDSAHWGVLCRARAIETQCYFLAVNQGGQHETWRHTYVHTMAIDPWSGSLVMPRGRAYCYGRFR